MAHKTLIGGTAYEISGGKTLIDGTAYSINNGKTLVDGTAYEIGFGAEFTITLPTNIYNNSNYCYVIHNGKKYYNNLLSEQTFKAKSGDIITCVAIIPESMPNGHHYIEVNGVEVVKTVYAPGTSTYEYTVISDATISCYHADMLGGGSYVKITDKNSQ